MFETIMAEGYGPIIVGVQALVMIVLGLTVGAQWRTGRALRRALTEPAKGRHNRERSGKRMDDARKDRGNQRNPQTEPLPLVQGKRLPAWQGSSHNPWDDPHTGDIAGDDLLPLLRGAGLPTTYRQAAGKYRQPYANAS